MDDQAFRAAIVRAIQEKFGKDVDVIDKQTIKKQYGWVVFYNTQAFIDTGDPMVGLMSNNPVLCLWDGRMLSLAMNCTVEEAVRELESEMSLL